ncbi:preprotein translocase subunit Tim44 [Sphingomonas paeninsulae]|uniref:Preprotein translocase subunit Tim44 n=1 Tax=Sphingomonas paeninsulae TaxID=2319844 RepID=A0A494TBL1_SPHPE|nr:TIM44-like domain-containing protein [Sphingomonas paeninsulae]AYJ86797.1 preprotein translocase subunit Tim44 [Sphingomonas paeninsulae]
MKQRSVRIATLITAPLLLASLAATPADARRGGSFGSRGSRTYDAPRPTNGSSAYVPPIQRSMTPRSAATDRNAYNPSAGAQSSAAPRSRFGGFGGGLIGGLVAGGLIGHFMGNGGGWGAGGGSGGGFLISLIQIAVLGWLVWMAIGFFRRRRAVSGPQSEPGYSGQSAFQAAPNAGPWAGAQQPQSLPPVQESVDIALTQTDQNMFEQLLINVQDAFGREDYGRLRELTTPEIMSYLAEELSENATQNRRNEVSGTRLLDAEVVEAWEEASGDYATIALHYKGIDLMRDRTTGTIVAGSASTATETNELWTFFRDGSGVWKLSAIQES